MRAERESESGEGCSKPMQQPQPVGGGNDSLRPSWDCRDGDLLAQHSRQRVLDLFQQLAGTSRADVEVLHLLPRERAQRRWMKPIRNVLR